MDKKIKGSVDVWLDAAFDLLIEGGVEAVKIMPLARRLAMTRTGFYYHFKDRNALLDALIVRWEAKNTGNLIAQANAHAATVTEAILNLFECWVNADLFDSRLDLAIRNWARTDEKLQRKLDRSDQARLKAVMDIFLRFDFAPEDAQVRSMTILYTQIGYISMHVQEDLQQRLNRMPEYAAIYTGRRPTEAEFAKFQRRLAFSMAENGILKIPVK